MTCQEWADELGKGLSIWYKCECIVEPVNYKGKYSATMFRFFIKNSSTFITVNVNVCKQSDVLDFLIINAIPLLDKKMNN